MNDPIPTPNPAEFGSYGNCLAARIDGTRANRGMSRAEIIGQFSKTDEGEDGGEDSVVIGKTDYFTNLSTGSLRV